LQKKIKWIIPIIIIVILASCACIWYFQIKLPHDKAVADFNSAVKSVEEENAKLDEAVNTAQAIIDSGEQPYDESALTTVTTAITYAETSKKTIPELPEKTTAIKNATSELLKPTDNTTTLSTITDKTAILESSIKQLKQITNPSGDFIVQKLEGIDGVSGTQAVTEDHDPNGNLNKEKGYTATIYFSSPWINQDEVSCADIVDKGTECGGAIEVYASVEDADTRNAYLSAFDGASMLNSGSHTILGTTVIRTSSKLSATQQNDLTQIISDKLIALQ
jgi:flagellar basal body-associated protein FliL